MNRYAAQPDPEAPDPVDAGPDGPKMWSQNLVVLYETDVDIAAMLPQPLEATDPIVRINLARGRHADDGRAAAGGHVLGRMPAR